MTTGSAPDPSDAGLEPIFGFLGELADQLPDGYWPELIERIHRRELALEMAEATSLEISVGVPVFVETLHAVLWALSFMEVPHD